VEKDGKIRPQAPWEQPTQIFEARLIDERAVPRAMPAAAISEHRPTVPPDVIKMLLPSEALTFASRPHPIVFLRPVLAVVAVALLLALALGYHVHHLEHGRNVSVPWLGGWIRIAAWALGGAALLRALLSLARAASYYLGFRVVTTNRRAFVISGLVARRVRPLGNGVMAGSSLTQSILGRLLNYGTISMKDAVIRDVREPVGVYRAFQGVANGVDGDRWAPTLRQTQIP
jgi:hypothetical protein